MKRMLLLIPVALIVVLPTGCGDFFEKDISGEQILITAPCNDARIPEGDIAFAWDVTEGAERYRLVIVGPSFDEAARLVCDLVIIPDSAAVSCIHTEAMSSGEYEWSLQALGRTSSSRRTVSALTVFRPAEEEGNAGAGGEILYPVQ